MSYIILVLYALLVIAVVAGWVQSKELASGEQEVKEVFARAMSELEAENRRLKGQVAELQREELRIEARKVLAISRAQSSGDTKKGGGGDSAPGEHGKD